MALRELGISSELLSVCGPGETWDFRLGPVTESRSSDTTEYIEEA